MKVFEVLRETTEQEIAQAAKGMVAKAKAGDIGGAANDMERVHNSIARMDIGSGLYDFMQKTLKQLKSLVASNPNHPEAPKFVQAIKDIEAGLPAMKQAAADSRRMAVDAGAGRQDVGEEMSNSEEEYKNLINQYFRKGWGFELGGGATYKMMWHELKAARRWLAQAVKAGEIEPGVDVAQDLTIRDKNGIEVGQAGHLTIKAAAALDKARNMASAAGKKLSSQQVDNITTQHNTGAEAQRDLGANTTEEGILEMTSGATGAGSIGGAFAGGGNGFVNGGPGTITRTGSKKNRRRRKKA